MASDLEMLLLFDFYFMLVEDEYNEAANVPIEFYPPVPILVNGQLFSVRGESPSFYFPGSKYFPAGKYWFRDYPNYWPRTGSRYIKFGPWTFHGYLKASPPKTR